jgi:hypothetical protein
MISDRLTDILATMHDVEDPRRHAVFATDTSHLFFDPAAVIAA